MLMSDDTGLYGETKKIFLNIFGPEVAKQLDNFQDPKKYPKDFLDQSKFFLSRLMGDQVAEIKLKSLYEKYIKNKADKIKRGK